MSSQQSLFPTSATNVTRRPSYKKICSGPNCAQLIIMIYNDNGKPQPYNLSPDQTSATTPHHETCVDVQLFKKRQATYRNAFNTGALDHE